MVFGCFQRLLRQQLVQMAPELTGCGMALKVGGTEKRDADVVFLYIYI